MTCSDRSIGSVLCSRLSARSQPMIPVGVCLASVGTSYASLRHAARVLEDLSYDSIWVWDHYLSTRDPRESVLECWTTLAGLAEATRSIRLGPLVANTTNHH